MFPRHITKSAWKKFYKWLLLGTLIVSFLGVGLSVSKYAAENILAPKNQEASNLEWQIDAATGSTSLTNPTTSRSFYVKILSPTENAHWYRLERTDSYAVRWTDRLGDTFTINGNAGGRSVENGPAIYKLSAWSDKPENGGQQLKEYSGTMPIYYDFSFENITFNITYSESGNGNVILKANPASSYAPELLGQIKSYEWTYYLPVTDTNGNITWKYSYTSTTTKPEFKVSFSEPGVKYVGVSALNHLSNTADYSINIRSKTSSVVVGVPPENGAPLEIKNGFSSTHLLASRFIPGNMRLGTTKEAITLFSNGVLYLPIDTDVGKNSETNPDKVEIDLPVGIDLQNGNSQNYTITDITSMGGSGIGTGYHRYRLVKKSGVSSWSWRNRTIAIFPLFTSQSVIGQTGLQMRIRAYKDGQGDRSDNWETTAITCENIPEITLPKRLTTSFTWASPNTFSPNIGDYPSDSNFFTLYRKLGFNNIPTTFINSNDPETSSSLFVPENRQTSQWEGLTYGPEQNALEGGKYGSNNTYAVGYYSLLNLGKFNSSQGLALKDGDIDAYVNNVDFNQQFNLTLTVEQISTEKTKWKNALHYYANKGQIDMAYDGVFLQRDLDFMGKLINRTKPEYYYLDCEGWQGTYNTWRDNIQYSANAQARRNDGETSAELAYRMLDEFLAKFSSTIYNISPNTKVAMYNAVAANNAGYQVFPWELLAKYHFISQPSVYRSARSTEEYATFLRRNRQFLNQDDEMMPWLTTGTYGELDSDTLFDQVIHTFLNGSTGFSIFADSYMDDMADVLNISKAIGLIAPYENVVMDGDIAFEDVSNISNATISAMKLNGEYLIGVTPQDTTKPVNFTISTGGDSNNSVPHKYNLSDLRHNIQTNQEALNFNYSGVLTESTVMRLVVSSITQPLPSVTPNVTPSAKPSVTLSPSITPSKSPVYKTGDINHDNHIDDSDFTLLLYWWGVPARNPQTDINQDNRIDDSDFTLLLYWWGK